MSIVILYKKTKEDKIKKLFFVSFLVFSHLLLLSSCAVAVKKIKPHHKAFAQVQVGVELILYECKEDPKTKKKVCGLNNLGKKAALGSGTFFRYKNYNGFLTAGHVCLGPVYEIWNGLPPGSKVKTEILLKSYTGHKIKGKIKYINLKYDLCIVDALHPTVKRIPSVSISKPALHENHYSVSSPVSIFDTGMVPVLQGLYVGNSKIFSFYTIPAAPGASGGAIYNSSNNIVGIVQRTHSLFPHVSLSIKHKDLNDILERFMDLREQKIDSMIE